MMTARKISAISKQDAIRICSGQAVVDLSTAVKELVENSLDAGATVVEVKLTNSGLDAIEVVDNGGGIDPSNFELLAKRSHTSKLRDFEDLDSLSSFGFRGEALSALCQISSSLMVCTRTVNESTGSLLEFDKAGSLISKKTSARQVGTTVTIRGLFEALPVRHGEFKRNIKKQLAKLMRTMQGFCLISVNKRISCSNSPDGKTRQTLIATQTSKTVADNLVTVFGSKFYKTLRKVDIEFSPKSGAMEVDSGESDAEESIERKSNNGDSNEENSETQDENKRPSIGKVEGYVSKAGEGVGRSDSDRQFFFINGRPVDIPKVARALNEVWRQFEMKQKPACILDFSLPPGSFDINISPDKREAMLTEEAAIIEGLKYGLNALWEPSRYTFKTQTLLSSSSFSSISSTQLPSSSSLSRSAPPALSSNLLPAKRSHQPTLSEGTQATRDDAQLHVADTRSTSSPFEEPSLPVNSAPSSESGSSSGLSRRVQDPEKRAETDSGMSFNKGNRNPTTKEEAGLIIETAIDLESDGTPQAEDEEALHAMVMEMEGAVEVEEALKENDEQVPIISRRPESDASMASSNCFKGATEGEEESSVEVLRPPSTVSPSKLCCSGTGHGARSNSSQQAIDATIGAGTGKRSISGLEKETSARRESPLKRQATALGPHSNRNQTLPVNLQDILWSFQRHSSTQQAPAEANGTSADKSALKRDDLSSQDEKLLLATADGVEQEASAVLERVFDKESFLQMTVIGQFNLGFIIARAGSDLFILDQHACDEKFNYERLMQSTTIHQQPLVSPIPLEINAGLEMVILDNLETFASNGFNLEVDYSASPTRKIQVKGLPFSRSTQFGVEDIHELASLLADNPAKTVRLPKAQAMFASRACRSSIMIGTALKHEEMLKVVRNLHQLDQPWNCPHGRPTMRFLARLPSEDSLR